MQPHESAPQERTCYSHSEAIRQSAWKQRMRKSTHTSHPFRIPYPKKRSLVQVLTTHFEKYTAGFSAESPALANRVITEDWHYKPIRRAFDIPAQSCILPLDNALHHSHPPDRTPLYQALPQVLHLSDEPLQNPLRMSLSQCHHGSTLPGQLLLLDRGSLQPQGQPSLCNP